MYVNTGKPSRVPRPRSRRLPRAVREQQILDAAVDVFASRGFHQASMDEISGSAGISKPMIYSYVGSKDDLFLACIRREFSRLLDAIGSAVDVGLPPDEQLWRGLRVFFEYVRDHGASWAILHRQTSPQAEPFTSELSEGRSQAMAVIAKLLARATAQSEQPRQPAQMEAFAAALIGAAEALVDWWTDNPDHTAEGLAMRLMNLVWMGFGDLVTGSYWTAE